jgi:hypothetical protein
MKDILDWLEESLWADRDGVILGAIGEIRTLRQQLAEQQSQILVAHEAVETFRSSVNDYLEASTLHEVELLRRKTARLNFTGSDTIEEICASLAEAVNSSGSSGPLESSLRMVTEQMGESSEQIDVCFRNLLLGRK